MSLLSLFLLSFATIVIAATTTLPLSHLYLTPPQPPPHHLAYLATASLTRAHSLQNPQTTHPTTTTTTTPLSPHHYGGYSITLNFGTPPQPIPFLVDTASNFPWFPCTHRYKCTNCTTSKTIPTFIPRLSSTSKILGCVNPKCGLLHDNDDVESRCSECSRSNVKNCTEICRPYLIIYGSGSTGGIAMLEKLHLTGKEVGGVVVGCSLFSSRQPAGIAGFGRGPLSLPSQLGLSKFSYCLISHRFDDTVEKSWMMLDTATDSGSRKTENLSYTQLVKSPNVAGKQAFGAYYYVGLRKITIGGQKVKIPNQYLSPSPTTGNGGTIVDSGTTFTYMTNNVYELVIKAFEEQVKEYKRATSVELETGLRPCFNVGGLRTVSLPEMLLHFKGGAEMALPVSNYFAVADAEAVCLTLVTGKETSGPAMIIGNFQLQNFVNEFDLKNKRFGFRQQSCKQ